jgi:hypothetical protein
LFKRGVYMSIIATTNRDFVQWYRKRAEVTVTQEYSAVYKSLRTVSAVFRRISAWIFSNTSIGLSRTVLSPHLREEKKMYKTGFSNKVHPPVRAVSTTLRKACHIPA